MKLTRRFATLAVVATVLLCASTALADDGQAILAAARSGEIQTMTSLLDADPSLVNAHTAAGETPLHYAAMGRSTAAMSLLLERGAVVTATDKAGLTPLHIAATSNNKELIGRLLAAGADANAKDTHGETPLHLAARRFHPEAVAVLLAAGADPNAKNVDGQTPLHVLGSAARDADGVQQVIDGVAGTLIAGGANPTLLDNAGVGAWPHPAKEEAPPKQPSGYPSYDSIVATLLAKETAYPSLCKRYDLGVSTATQHIYALKISDNVNVEEDEPEFKWVSTMHGNETSGAIMCLNMIDYLLPPNYGTVPRVTDIVNNMEIWIVPCMNPYGYADNGRYNANDADLNRSFPEGSGPSPDPNPNPSTGREPEVNTIINWTFAHSFTLAANFHEGVMVVNYPYDNDNLGSNPSPSPDDDLFIYISKQYSYYNSPMWNNPDFPPYGITNGADWYAIDGGMQDWDYRYMGCNEVTIEISNTQSPSYSLMSTYYWPNNRDSMLAYMETSLIGVRGIVTGPGGAPLAATVTVVGRNHPIYTDPNVGDYHRMLMPGTYSLTFTASGYSPITVTNVVVSSGAATVLNVSFGPHPPTATGSNLATPTCMPITVTLTATDDGFPNPPAALSYIITSLPTHGSLTDPGTGSIGSVPYTLVNASHQVLYTPNTWFQGNDSFQFKANDGGTPPQGGDSNTATIAITVGGTGVLYSWNMNTNPGWTISGGQWAYGQPTGSGGDPSSGHTGTNVYGYNLNGWYGSVIPAYYLTTTAINCATATNTVVKFWRWLGVEEARYDHAKFQVSDNGTAWTTLWENPSGYGNSISETAWSQQSYDISAVADNHATVYLRWVMGITDGTVFYCGWNIDDVEIWGVNCGPSDTTPPTPSPMTFVSAPAPASTTDIAMTASTATDAATPPVSYYFNFVSGGSGGNDSAWQAAPNTSYTDSGLTANTGYTYRVKARDSVTPLPNETSYSSNAATATLIETPTGVSFGTVTNNSIVLNATGTLTNLTTISSGVYFDSTTTGGDGGINLWVTTTTDTATSLSPNTSYTFQVKARNQNSVETAYGPTASKVTSANVPAAPTLGSPTTTTMTLDVNANGNPAATVYAIQCTATSPNDAAWLTKYVNAGGAPIGAALWQTDAAWGVITIIGLQPATTYTFAVKARNQESVETAFGPGASLATGALSGACCYDSAPCAILTSAACAAGSGSYKGDGSTCTLHLCCLVMGDMSGDAVVSGVDIQGFVEAMLGAFDPCADFNGNEQMDVGDISEFINALLAI